MIGNIRFAEIKTGWRHDHGKGEKLRLYFSKDKDGKENVYLDVAVEELLEVRSTMPVPITLYFARVFWDDADKLLMIQPESPDVEEAREIILEEAFSSDTISRWENKDIEALLKEKAPIEEFEIGYCVNGTWDSEQQQLTYDFKQRIPIKEDTAE